MITSWATKRRLLYAGLFILLVLAIGWLLYFKILYRTPTCTDGIQNGDEKGIDCGGSCQNLCTSEALTPIVLWSKAFPVTSRVYNVAAYVQNPNLTSDNQSATYVFSMYDVNGTLVASRDGKTAIPKNKKFVVFEANVIATTTIKRVDFKFTSFGPWKKDTAVEPMLNIVHSPLQSTTTVPRIDGTITNGGGESIDSVELVALVLDNKENAVAVSRTFVDNLVKNVSQDFVFTWPRPFDLGVESCSQPVDLAFLIDRSGSMKSEGGNPPEPFSTVKSTAENFIYTLGDEDQASIISFGTNAVTESMLSQNTQQALSSIDALSLGTTSQQTNITDALNLAFAEFTSPRVRQDSKKVVILLTDGVPTEPIKTGQADYPKVSAELAAKSLRDSGVTIYTIGLGSDISEGFLKTLSGSTGQYLLAPSKETLSSIYTKISGSLCQRKPNVVQIIYRVI